MANTETHEQTHAPDHKRPPRSYKILVNGRERIVEIERLSFEEVLLLAFDPVPTGPGVMFTMTYRHAAQRPHEGTLVEGQSVEIKNRTIFNVTATNKS